MNKPYQFYQKKILPKITISFLFLNFYIIFLFYLTNKPFQFSINDSTVFNQLDYFFNTVIHILTIASITKSDIFANIVVFIPYGVLLHWYFWQKNNFNQHINWKKLILTILITTITIEFLQLFLPIRKPSILDIISNLFGGVIGIYSVKYLLKNYNHFVVKVNHLLNEKWDVKFFIVLILILLFYAWFPLSFSVSLMQIQYHLNYLLKAKFQIMNIFDAIPYLIFFFYIQLLSFEINEKYIKQTKILTKIFISLALTIGVVFILFTVQSLIAGRLFNFEDFIMVFTGIIIGVIFAIHLLLKNKLLFNRQNDNLEKILKITLFLNFAFILGASIFPFNFDISTSSIIHKLELSLIPFNSYIGNSSNIEQEKIFILMDFLKDLFKFTSLTIIVSAIFYVKKEDFKRSVFIYLLIFITVLEFVQIFNKDFNPDISDIILGAISLYLGRRIWKLATIILK